MEPPSQDPSNRSGSSDKCSIALPAWRKSPWWHLLHPDFAWALATMALTSLSLILLMRLWSLDLRIPFTYGSDTSFVLMIIKGVLIHGWWFENPDLGAPYGQELYDFPALVGDSFHLIAIKLLGVFSSDPALVLNLYFLLAFPLVALASFLVLRQLRISRGAALVCSVIYALAPYHFLRGEMHLFLAAYYSVPVGSYLVLSLLSGQPLFTRRSSTEPRVLAWASRRSLITLVLCLFIVSAGSIYYTVFTGILLVAATALVLITRRDTRTLVQGSVLLVVIFGFLALSALPVFTYWLANGPNDIAANRLAEESEIYGLKLAQMVLPVPDHPVQALSNLAQYYYYGREQKVLLSDGPRQGLGLIAALGFLWHLLVALAGCLSPHWKAANLWHRQLATTTVITFLVGTTGGISALFTYLVSPQIRVWSRISIFIAFFGIAAVALLLDALQDRIHLRWGRPVLVGTLLLSVLVIGFYDQSSNQFLVGLYSRPTNPLGPDYSTSKAEYENDAAFIKMIDSKLPPQAEVFQLPYMPFPEYSRPIQQLNDYELLRPYILDDNGLRWSYGAMKGRPAADWQKDVADKPTEDLVSEISAAGFDGIYIDRFGYPDRAAKLEGELAELLEVKPLVSPNGRMSFFSLLPYKER